MIPQGILDFLDDEMVPERVRGYIAGVLDSLLRAGGQLRGEVERERQRADTAEQKASELEASLRRKTTEVEAANQRAEQLDRKLSAAKEKLRESRNALREAKGQVAALQRDTESLHAELQAERDRVAGLQEESGRLRQNQVPAGVTLLQLPSRTLPPVSFPQKWTIDIPGLQKFNSSMDVHQRAPPCSRPFLQEYGRVFQPLMEETLPQRLFLARGAASQTDVRVQCSSQVVGTLKPGQLLPKGPLPVELRPFPLRPEEKLLDSPEAGQVRLIFRERDAISSDVREAAPPSYRFLASVIEKSDPLRSETRHASIRRLRSAVQASRALYRIERAGGVEEALEVLEKAVRLGKDTERQTKARGKVEPPARGATGKASTRPAFAVGRKGAEQGTQATPSITPSDGGGETGQSTLRGFLRRLWRG